MSRHNHSSQQPTDAPVPVPAVPSPCRRRLLAAAIAMEAAWIVVLAVLAIAR
jgi:hypothetical protein